MISQAYLYLSQINEGNHLNFSSGEEFLQSNLQDDLLAEGAFSLCSCGEVIVCKGRSRNWRLCGEVLLRIIVLLHTL